MLRKLAWYAFLAIVAIWLVNDPTGAAHLVHQGMHDLGRAANSFTTIASNL